MLDSFIGDVSDYIIISHVIGNILVLASGGPAFIVILSFGFSVHQYGNHYFCWLSVHDTAVWSLVGPICLIVIVTLGVFVMTLKSSFHVKDTVLNFGNLRTLLWLAIMLLPIQGSTWVLAMLSVNETHVILHYAFSIFCLMEGIYIFTGYCVINKKVHHQLCFMWTRVSRGCVDGLSEPQFPSHSPSAYFSSSKVSHRSIGISTSSATSHSTSKTSASPRCTDSQIKISDHGISDGDEPPSNNLNSNLIVKTYPVSKSSPSHPDSKQLRANLADVMNGNCELACERSEEKPSESMGSSSPGPKMGINIFSYPHLPALWSSSPYGGSSNPSLSGSRSPMGRPTLSLKMGLSVNDQWDKDTAVEKKISSPLSAPISTLRPDFPTPRMGISGVEKCVHSSRDRLIDGLSIGPATTSQNGVSCTSISNASSKEILSDSSCPSSPLSRSKNSPVGRPRLYERRVLASREKLISNSRKPLQKATVVDRDSQLKMPPTDQKEDICLSKEGDDFGPNKLLNTCSLGHKSADSLSVLNIQKPNTLPKAMSQEISDSGGSSHSIPQSTLDAIPFFDRISPRLIDDTPSEDDGLDLVDLPKRNSSEDDVRVPRFAIPKVIAIPPLATAELSDTECRKQQESVV